MDVAGTSSTVIGLTNGTTYYFMVAAVNAGRSQNASREFVGTPAEPTLKYNFTLNNISAQGNFNRHLNFLDF